MRNISTSILDEVKNLNLACDWLFVKTYVKPVWQRILGVSFAWAMQGSNYCPSMLIVDKLWEGCG
jgi:hypothetical protein